MCRDDPTLLVDPGRDQGRRAPTEHPLREPKQNVFCGAGAAVRDRPYTAALKYTCTKVSRLFISKGRPAALRADAGGSRPLADRQHLGQERSDRVSARTRPIP